jgi:hypothetical protein
MDILDITYYSDKTTKPMRDHLEIPASSIHWVTLQLLHSLYKNFLTLTHNNTSIY